MADVYDVVKQCDDAANGALALLEDHIGVLQTFATPSSSVPPSAAPHAAAPTAPSGHRLPPLKLGARLPKFGLLRFDATVTKRQPFLDMFRHSVHENTKLSNANRFRYMIFLLDGYVLRKPLLEFR